MSEHKSLSKVYIIFYVTRAHNNLYRTRVELSRVEQANTKTKKRRKPEEKSMMRFIYFPILWAAYWGRKRCGLFFQTSSSRILWLCVNVFECVCVFSVFFPVVFKKHSFREFRCCSVWKHENMNGKLELMQSSPENLILCVVFFSFLALAIVELIKNHIMGMNRSRRKKMEYSKFRCSKWFGYWERKVRQVPTITTM